MFGRLAEFVNIRGLIKFVAFKYLVDFLTMIRRVLDEWTTC